MLVSDEFITQTEATSPFGYCQIETILKIFFLTKLIHWSQQVKNFVLALSKPYKQFDLSVQLE